jgi:hypothetical protein
MEKFYVGDDSEQGNEEDSFDIKPKSVFDLKNRVSKMSIFAEVETRGKKTFVRVLDNTGTHHFLSSASVDYAYLNQHCDKRKQIGIATFYYFKF